MTKTAAQVLGAIAGAVAAVGWLLWWQLRPPSCKGAVFVEFRPPLLQPGPYRFSLALDGEPSHCTFEVALPADKPVNTGKCGMPLELQTRGVASDASIIGLTVGATCGESARDVLDRRLVFHPGKAGGVVNHAVSILLRDVA